MTDQNNDSNDPIPSDLVRQDESFADLVREFVDGLDQRMSDIDHAVGAGDFQVLKGLAHQLKGSGGGYGYPVLTELAAQVEQYAVSEALPECQKAVDNLRATLARVVVALE